MIKFPHISLLRNVLAYVQHVNTDPEVPEKYRVKEPVQFVGTIKLHGSNCGVVWDLAEDTLTAQSRETTLTPEADYKGFAKFVVMRADRIREILTEQILLALPEEVTAKIALYGEWVGPGVARKNKGSAVSTFDGKHWALFGAYVLFEGEGEEPQDVSHLLYGVELEGRIGTVYKAGQWNLTIDFNDPEAVKAAEAEVQVEVGRVGEQCPYGKLYGLTGAGEGIVWRPVGPFLDREDLYWKAKTAAHQVVDRKEKKVRPVVGDDEKAQITAFVDATVTENRLEQGLDALEQRGFKVEKRNTGKFIQWVTGDVERECALELEEAGLTWKQVSGAVTTRAREFLFAQFKK